jgi:colanic acid biosynthesis glycosyl transferase WcaI
LRILIITQVFYPDTVATGQVLWDLAEFIAAKGNTVTTITSKYPYEDKHQVYPNEEYVKGVRIIRLGQSKLGKSNSFFRIIDFFSFNISIFIKLLGIRSKDYDVILGTTVPPFLALIGVLISKIKKIPFCYYVMDLQPELSIASGLLKSKSFFSRILTYLGNYSINKSSLIISLDNFMTQYLCERGAKLDNIITVPIWPLMENRYTGSRIENPFRKKFDFGDKIVCMYSGNHAYVHPLDTILNTAKALSNDDRFLFVFIGGGVRKKDVTNFVKENGIRNVLQLPFQPRNIIHESLASADVQIVILGDGMVGFTHPNKIYGALFVGKPILYVGPQQSHVTEILSELPGNIICQHGEVKLLTNKLIEFADSSVNDWKKIGDNNSNYAERNFNPDFLKNKIYQGLLSLNDRN